MPRFSTQDAELAVEFSDEGGQPVVQLHGLTSSRRRDRLLGLDLGRGLNGTRLLRYDARGHGLSTGRAVAADYRWQVLAADLLRLLDAFFGDEPVHGVGASMGAGTLLHAAVREPGRFSGLTLMVPATAWETRAAQARDYLRAADLIEKIGVARYLAVTGNQAPPPATAGAPATPPDAEDSLLPWLFRGAALSDLPDPRQLAGLGMPCTILAWRGDPVHPLSTANRLAELLPAATLEVAGTPADLARWPGILARDVARHRAAGSGSAPGPHPAS